jgi:hypothetical protein
MRDVAAGGLDQEFLALVTVNLLFQRLTRAKELMSQDVSRSYILSQSIQNIASSSGLLLHIVLYLHFAAFDPSFYS